MILQEKSLTETNDHQPFINVKINDWISTKPTLATVYLALFPWMIINNSLHRIQMSSNASTTLEDVERSILLALHYVARTIEDIDWYETLKGFLLNEDSSICETMLNCVSSIVVWHTLAVNYMTCGPNRALRMYMHQLFSLFSRSFNPPMFKVSLIIMLIQPFDSPDTFIIDILKGRRNDEQQIGKRRMLNSVLLLVTSISSKSRSFHCPKSRQALWRCLWLISLLLDPESLKSLPSISLQSSVNDPLPSLDWLIWTCFNDQNETTRNFGSRRLGLLLGADNFKILKSLYPDLSITGDIHGEHFLTKCDVWMRSICYGPNISSPYLCHLPFQDVMLGSPYSHQRTFLHIFSSICQYTPPDSDLGIFLLTQAVLRMIRFYLSSFPENSVPSQILETHKILFRDIISSIAIEELHLLGDKFQLWTNLLERCKDVFTQMIFREFFSGKIEKRTSEHCHKPLSQHWHLSHFIQSFLLNPSLLSGTVCHQDELERFDGTLFFTDEALPAVIASIIISQQYDILLACTGFRLGLVRFITAARKNRGRHFTSEYIVGMVFRHQSCRDRLTHSFSTIELKRQTALLCVTDKDGLRILGRLLTRYESVEFEFPHISLPLIQIAFSTF